MKRQAEVRIIGRPEIVREISQALHRAFKVVAERTDSSRTPGHIRRYMTVEVEAEEVSK